MGMTVPAYMIPPGSALRRSEWESAWTWVDPGGPDEHLEVDHVRGGHGRAAGRAIDRAVNRQTPAKSAPGPPRHRDSDRDAYRDTYRDRDRGLGNSPRERLRVQAGGRRR